MAGTFYQWAVLSLAITDGCVLVSPDTEVTLLFVIKGALT